MSVPFLSFFKRSIVRVMKGIVGGGKGCRDKEWGTIIQITDLWLSALIRERRMLLLLTTCRCQMTRLSSRRDLLSTRPSVQRDDTRSLPVELL